MVREFKTATGASRFTTYYDSRGEVRWRLVAPNGVVIADGSSVETGMRKAVPMMRGSLKMVSG